MVAENPRGQAAMRDALEKPLQIPSFDVQTTAFSAQDYAGLMGAKPPKPNSNNKNKISYIFNPWHNHTEKQRKKLSHAGSARLAWKRLQDRGWKRNQMNLLFCRSYEVLHARSVLKRRKEGGSRVSASKGGGICTSNRYLNQGGLTEQPALHPSAAALQKPGVKTRVFPAQKKGIWTKRGKDKFHLLNQTSH